jgi:phosphoglycolate phosphatase
VLRVTTRTAFLFDLDGTLADTLADLTASANHVRSSFGLPPVDDAAVRGFVGDGARTLLRRALAGLDEPLTDALVDDAFQRYVEHHREQCTRLTVPFPGVRQHLEHLHDAGHALAVVTNKPERFAIPVVHHIGLAELLPVVIGGDTLPQRKPDPAPLRHALERLGAEITGATMVGDGVQDLRAGKALGLRTIACLFGYGDPEALRAEGADAYWTAFGRN